jgi:signal transduction histidine kinase
VKGNAGGSGIGLSIVKNIVDTYGGETRVTNDDGARFEFSLKDYPVSERSSEDTVRY